MDKQEYTEKLRRLSNDLLTKHGAIDAISGQEFIGYIGQDTDGQWWCDVFSWSVNHGKIYGATRADVERAVSSAWA